MDRLICCLGMLILSVAFVVPTITAQEKKADDPKTADVKKDDDKKDPKPGDEKKDVKPDPKPKSKPKVDWGYTVDYAKVITVDTKDEKEFTVQIQYKMAQPNPGAQQQILQAQQQIAQAQQSLAKAKTAQERQQALQQLATAQFSLQKALASQVTYKDATYDFKCKAVDNMRIRHFNPQVEVDESSGEFKKLTKKDLENLRADGYPVYPAQFKALAVGQVVRVYFSKDTTGLAYGGKDKKGPAVPIDDQPDPNQPRYWDVIQVVIVAEPPMPKGK